jgi:putative aminopeptidase FrvX
MKPDTVFIDVGCSSKEEVEKLGIHVGSVAVFEANCEWLNEKYIIGRALDNRMGGFMIAEVARHLFENKHTLPFTVYLVNSVQEEIGLRGAEMIARRIKPNIAIVTDVTHDTHTPMINKAIEGDIKCGNGPSLAYAPAIHNKLLKIVEDTATAKKIPVQFRTLSRSTGTDTDSFAYANDGCPSVLISIPLRYMHTTVEMIHKKDITDTIQLMYETLLNLSPKTNLSYL